MRLGTTVPSQFQRARRLPPTVDSRRGFWQTVPISECVYQVYHVYRVYQVYLKSLAGK